MTMPTSKPKPDQGHASSAISDNSQGAASSAISNKISNAAVKEAIQAQLDKQQKAAANKKLKLPNARGGQAKPVQKAGEGPAYPGSSAGHPRSAAGEGPAYPGSSAGNPRSAAGEGPAYPGSSAGNPRVKRSVAIAALMKTKKKLMGN